MHFDTIVDLDATAPLRTVQDIMAACETLETGSWDNVVSAMPARRSPISILWNSAKTVG